MGQSEPDVRPMGYLALGAALLSVGLSVTYFFSPLAYLAAAIALPLGVVSRSEQRTRRAGSIAIVLAVLAVVVASWLLISLE